jgi:DNA-3-methyladenine glycosylase
MDILSKEFFINDASVVAKELLGKILVRKFNGHLLSGKIVETEAYFGGKDPASRAYKGYNNFAKLMWDEPGKVFIYMVHERLDLFLQNMLLSQQSFLTIDAH